MQCLDTFLQLVTTESAYIGQLLKKFQKKIETIPPPPKKAIPVKGWLLALIVGINSLVGFSYSFIRR